MPLYNTTLTTSTATTTNNLLWNGSYYWSDPLTFRYEPAYMVPPEIRANPVAEGAALPETDLAWLKRRVDEISWRPA